MITMGVLKACNHIVEKKEKQYGKILMSRSSLLLPDKVPDNIHILRIDRITNEDESVQYTEEVDYTQSTSLNIIEWVDSPTVPRIKDKYYIHCLYTKTVILNQTIDTCERCNGNGWYVSIFEDSADVFFDSDKLLQDFMKILFTEKQEDGYGTYLRDLVGVNVYSEDQLASEVNDVLEDCIDQLKELQASSDNITDKETLDSVVINNICYDKEESTCYVSITISNIAGENIDLTFSI